MRIRADDMRVNERWTVSFAAVARGTVERGIAGHGIGTVDFFEMEIRESRDQARDTSACGLHFDRHRDRIAVIFHTENYGQLPQSSRLHAFPELTFTRTAFPIRNVPHFAAL